MKKKINTRDVDILSNLILLVSLGVLGFGLPMLIAEMDKSTSFRNIVWAVIGIIIAIIFISLYIYFWRRIVKYKNFVLNARSNIEIQLSKRSNLIDGLVKIVKKYQKFEEKIIRENIQKNRRNILIEKYPTLKAENLFLELIDNLDDCENELAAARDIYNENVLDYNQMITTFPTNLIASIHNFEKIEYWKEEEKIVDKLKLN